MATIQPTSLTRWELTPQEFRSGVSLSLSQKQVIQNDVADISEQLLSLSFNPSNPQQFLQDDSFLKGQLAFAKLLLARAEETIPSEI